MKKYKTIRISDSVLSDVRALQTDGETLINAIDGIIDKFNESQKYIYDVVIKEGDIYYLDIEGIRRAFKTNETLNNIIRVTEDVFNKLNSIKAHPDETFNTTIFRAVSTEMAVIEWNTDN